MFFFKMTRSVIKPKEPEFVFHFTFFTTRTNFKPKQTQTNSFILVLSEAVTTRDNLHVRFGSHFCFKRSSHANRNNRKDKRSTKDNSPCLVCVCVLRGKGKAVSGVFRFAELLTTFRRSLWKVFLGAFVLGFN